MNESTLTIGDKSESAPPKDNGIAGGKASDLLREKSSRDSSRASSPGGPAPGGSQGTGKKKGRPPKNAAGFSKEKIDEEVGDPEVEAAREEFESCLVAILVTATDGLADTKFESLKILYPDAVARGLSDKFRLTEKERKYFGSLAIRLWRKYIGDSYLFTDESIAALYAVQYIMRNIEGMVQSRKAESVKHVPQPKSAAEQSGVQSPPNPDRGSSTDGKEHLNGAPDSQSPGAARVGL